MAGPGTTACVLSLLCRGTENGMSSTCSRHMACMFKVKRFHIMVCTLQLVGTYISQKNKYLELRDTTLDVTGTSLLRCHNHAQIRSVAYSVLILCPSPQCWSSGPPSHRSCEQKVTSANSDEQGCMILIGATNGDGILDTPKAKRRISEDQRVIKRVTRLSCQLIIMPCPFPHRYDFGDVILREQQGPTQWPRIYYIYALSGTSTTSSCDF